MPVVMSDEYETIFAMYSDVLQYGEFVKAIPHGDFHLPEGVEKRNSLSTEADELFASVMELFGIGDITEEDGEKIIEIFRITPRTEMSIEYLRSIPPQAIPVAIGKHLLGFHRLPLDLIGLPNFNRFSEKYHRWAGQ